MLTLETILKLHWNRRKWIMWFAKSTIPSLNWKEKYWYTFKFYTLRFIVMYAINNWKKEIHKTFTLFYKMLLLKLI